MNDDIDLEDMRNALETYIAIGKGLWHFNKKAAAAMVEILNEKFEQDALYKDC